MSINPTALTVAEGDSGSYSVVLDSEPTAEVTVTVSGHVGTDVTVSDAMLTFTPADWSTAQTVTVTASEDDDAAEDPDIILSHAVTGSGEYQGVTAASVKVTITEGDTAAVSINPVALSVLEGDADGASYSVVLTAQPSADVTVEISGHAGTDVTVSDAPLTFTPDDWNVAQTVTVTATRDPDAATDDPVTLYHAVTGTGEYASVAAASVTVIIDEVDTAAVSINPTALSVLEGDAGGASYSVVLTTQPSADVTVDRQRPRRDRSLPERSHAERRQFADLHSSELEHCPDGDGHRGPGS